MQKESSDRKEKPKIALPSGDAYAVLVVGGTSSEVFPTPKRPWRDLGQQASFLVNMGRVYQALAKCMSEDHIICIALLQETLSWLEECVKVGHPPCPEDKTEECRKYYRIGTKERLEWKRQQYKDMLSNVKEACKPILERNGGCAHYDGKQVTPETIINVMTGVAPEGASSPTTLEESGSKQAPPVVPQKGVKSVFLWTNTHGGHHAVSVGVEERKKEGEGQGEMKPKAIDPGELICDVCGKAHLPDTQLKREMSHDHSSLKTREWFMLMPYRTPNTALYDCISTAGHVMDYKAPNHLSSPLQRFYWQHIFSVMHKSQKMEPGRAIICLYQFCTAGGHLKWMENSAMETFHRTQCWPVFMMATAREQQYSLGFSFTNIFLDRLVNELKEDDNNDSSSSSSRKTSTTLKQLYTMSVEKYWKTHKVEATHNKRAASPSFKYGEIEFVCGKESGVLDISVERLFLNKKKPPPQQEDSEPKKTTATT